MAVIKIAHLSDLHFKPGKTLAIWQQVVNFVNQEIQPLLVLVTGDVTDNATHAEFELAAGELARLTTQGDGDPLGFRIIAGNHDRFAILGNTFKWLAKSKYLKDKEGRFSLHFTDRIVSAANPYDVEIRAERSSWKLRIIGLDSNAADQYFAQGYVSQESIAEAATAARGSDDRDLVIALVHHHVLPIPQLEIDRGATAGLKALPNVTGLLNSGSLLNVLSVAHVG